MSYNQRGGASRERKWKVKPNVDHPDPAKSPSLASTAADAVESNGRTHVPNSTRQQPSVVRSGNASMHTQRGIWKPKSYGTLRGATGVGVENAAVKAVEEIGTKTAALEKGSRLCHSSLFIASPSTAGARSLSFGTSTSDPLMAYNQRSGGYREQSWKNKSNAYHMGPAKRGSVAATAAEIVNSRVSALNTAESNVHGQRVVWKSKPHRIVTGVTSVVEAENATVKAVNIQENIASTAALGKSGPGSSESFTGSPLDKCKRTSPTFACAEMVAAFDPKFENEMPDQEVRMKMIDLVSKGLASLEVSLKHSGSLFTYAGHKGGAYVNSGFFGNIYTAVGVFVFGRMFREAWGNEARKKQAEFNDLLEKNHMCISMELVTAVLGDHGQRPREDYVVVTAVTELNNGKPKFYNTADMISFCRTWCLPTNDVWIFSTRNSVTTFFAAYDTLCEEGTTTSVCTVLDEVADLSVTGSKKYLEGQGEILEGLVARIVHYDTSVLEQKILRDCDPPSFEGDGLDLGPSLREICAANRSEERQQIKALLHSVGTSFCPDYLDWFGSEVDDEYQRNDDQSIISKFLQAHPTDYSTAKLQEMICLMKEKHYPVTLNCYYDLHKVGCLSSDSLFLKLVGYACGDSAFQRRDAGLWPLYRGFVVGINIFKPNRDKDVEVAKTTDDLVQRFGDSCGTSGLVDEDANLMIKLSFLPYRLRTFLIRDGLSILFKEGRAAYKAYYLRHMNNWGTSSEKQWALSKMLDEWAVYVEKKYVHKQLLPSLYLSEAEPFLEQYAKRSPENNVFIGYGGNMVRAEDFLAIVEDEMGEEQDLEGGQELVVSTISPLVSDTNSKNECLIIFFAGMPGSAKSGLCREIFNARGGLGDGRQISCLMGDYVKGVGKNYWQEFADECKRKSHAILLADKNAPNEEAWRKIEGICRETMASAVPVVHDSEGTNSNPFSLDALAVFMARVFQRNNHPGNLDKASPNAGYVLLFFYHLLEGKCHKEYERELVERFGSLVRVPLLKSDRSPMPKPLRSILEEGINLYKLHCKSNGRLESLEGSYAKHWAKWEKRVQEIILDYSDYLNSIRVPFEVVVKKVLEQLRTIARGKYTRLSLEKITCGVIAFAAVSFTVTGIRSLLESLAETDPSIEAFLKDRHMEECRDDTCLVLAHKKSHGVVAVARYAPFLHQNVSVDITALLFSTKVAALEACLSSIDRENISSKDQQLHAIILTEGVAAEEANMLQQLALEGKATRIDINPSASLMGTMEFY